jgi:DNA adenine methylase
MSIHIIKYPGSKQKYLDKILPIVNQYDADYYIEPFIGGGSVFINTPDNYKQYIINDINPHLLKIYYSFKNGTYKELVDFYNKNILKYGNWGKNKDSYYSFRDDMNDKLFNTDTNEEGYFYYLISKSCINSLLRWGPRGFNQGFGNRGRFLNLTLDEFNTVKKKLQKTQIYNTSYEEIFTEYDKKKSFYFLDPPYIGNLKYYGLIWDENKQLLFLNKLQTTTSGICYTNINININSERLKKWNKIKIADLSTIRPGKKHKIQDEVMYFNYKLKNKLF